MRYNVLLQRIETLEHLNLTASSAKAFQPLSMTLAVTRQYKNHPIEKVNYMKFLSRIWIDVRRGENVELYITALIAIGLVILNLFGIVPQTFIEPLILTVLALLAISNLGNRYQMEEVKAKLSQSTETFFLEKYPPTLERDIERASELWLVSVSLTFVTRAYYSRIEQILKKGSIVRILLVHPEGPAVEMAESRAYGRPNVERARREILGSLDDYCSLKATNGDRLEIRTIRNPLGHSIIAVNPDTSSGILYIQNYPFKTAGGAMPVYVIRAKDGQ